MTDGVAGSGSTTCYHRYARTRARIRRYTGVVPLSATKREKCRFFQTLRGFAFYAHFHLGTLEPKAADGGEDDVDKWLRGQ